MIWLNLSRWLFCLQARRPSPDTQLYPHGGLRWPRLLLPRDPRHARGPLGPIRSAWNLAHPYTSFISHPSSFCHPWSVMLHRISYSTVQFFNSTCSSCPHPHPARYLKVEQDGPDVPCHQLLWGLHRQGYQAVLGWNRSLMDYLKQILSCWLYVLLSSCFWSITFLTLLFGIIT